jgi:hypothetical protein
MVRPELKEDGDESVETRGLVMKFGGDNITVKFLVAHFW